MDKIYLYVKACKNAEEMFFLGTYVSSADIDKMVSDFNHLHPSDEKTSIYSIREYTILDGVDINDVSEDNFSMKLELSEYGLVAEIDIDCLIRYRF